MQPATSSPQQHVPTAQCSHCGLAMDAPARWSGDTPLFCCVGCEAVYYAIHASGMDDFYRLRTMTASSNDQPVQPSADAIENELHSIFDVPELIEQHTQLLDDGTRELTLYLDGVHCAGCVYLCEQLPFQMAGVHDARLDLSRGRLYMRWHPDQIKLSKAIKWITQFGYRAHWMREDRIKGRSKIEQKLLLKVGVSWALAANIMLLAIAMYAGLDLMTEPVMASRARWLSFALSAISVTYGGGVFFRRAIVSIRHSLSQRGKEALQALSMDVPIALGVLVGFIHSTYATIIGQGEVWFDSLAVLIAALLTARWLQLRGRRYATDAAERLLSLLPSMARRVIPSHNHSISDSNHHDAQAPTTEQIPSQLLAVGDLIEVRAGEVIPADGIIESGSSRVYRAILTGESRPEQVEVGDRVDAGITNLGSVINLRVLASGQQTRVGKLLHWIEERANERAPFVQLVDRMGGYFVAVVLLAAMMTGIIWSFVDPSQAISHVVALLVISCPCALGMGTPLALAIGVGQAARRGIFIKHDDVLEQLSRAQYVILDKTGTLTQGRMTIASIFGNQQALNMACSLEQHSNHPIAQAFKNWQQSYADANFSHHDVKHAREITGCGMTGIFDGNTLSVGRFDWLQSLPDAQWTKTIEKTVLSYANQGYTPVCISINNRIETVLAIGDTLREHSFALVDSLKQRGIIPVLLSGDHNVLVDYTAKLLGIDAKFALGNQSPEDKRDYIHALQTRENAVVVMVGDGVNDAAALQMADIGITVNGGAEASLVAADIFITASGVKPLLELFSGAHNVMHVVHRNLVGSALYNVVGISLASMGFVAPLFAAVAMPISSLAVVASSLLQRSFIANLDKEKVEPDRAEQKLVVAPGLSGVSVANANRPIGD